MIHHEIISSSHTWIECLICSWLYGSIWIIPPLFGWGRFIKEGFGVSCTFDYKSRHQSNRLFILLLIIGGFIIPLFAILISYTLIFSRLRRRAHDFIRKETFRSFTHLRSYQSHQRSERAPPISQKRSCSSENKPLRRTFHRTQVRAFQRSIIICFLFCFSWGPYACITLLFQFDQGSWITPYVAEVLALITKVAACINPFVYLVSSPAFRAKFFLVWPTLIKIRKKQPSEH